ncbi:MAG: D-alanyl-D-alanine carboxypeptidase [Clostridia bacterium]|nr:D-alanyl-D-alanine carboxypeptidase [Clostridia bacterium]
MRKRQIIGIFFLVIFSIPLLLGMSYKKSDHDCITLKCNAAVLAEQNTGKILYHKDMDKRMYPASTTKILTALVAIENGDLDEVITVGEEAGQITSHSSNAGLQYGDKLTFRELLMGLMLPSGNDAANVVAVHIARKVYGQPDMGINDAIDKFAYMMNERAKKAGAESSNFVNPHGLHDPNHYTTAHDMCLIAVEAMKNQIFREIVGTLEFVPDIEREQLEDCEEEVDFNGFKWKNSNLLLKGYPYITGIKTGFTTPAGYCLISSASKGEVDVISVVMYSTREDRWKDSVQLLGYGLDNFVWHDITIDGSIQAIQRVEKGMLGYSDYVVALSDRRINDIVNKDEIDDIRCTIVWDDILQAPIYKGQEIGKATFTLNGVKLGECRLIAGNRVVQAVKCAEGARRHLYYIFVLLMMLLLLILFISIKNRKLKKTQRY